MVPASRVPEAASRRRTGRRASRRDFQRGIWAVFPLREEIGCREVAAKRDQTFAVLEQAGILPLELDAQRRLKTTFDEVCRERWIDGATEDPDLLEAREEVAQVDEIGGFDHQRGTDAFEERHEAMAEPLARLADAGRDGIAHLAALVHTDSWASPLATDTLLEFASSTGSNRALVEATFVPGDWVPDQVVRNVDQIPADERLPALQAVAEFAHDEGVELQGHWWTALFTDEPEDPILPLAPTTDLGSALAILFEHGHHGALAQGLESTLDPALDGPDTVAVFLEDEGVQAAVDRIREADGGQRLAARGQENSSEA